MINVDLIFKAEAAAAVLFAAGGLTWRYRRTRVPTFPDDQNLPTPLLGSDAITGRCRLCRLVFELPPGQTALIAVAENWHVVTTCPTCRHPYTSPPLSGVEAGALRSMGVIDGQTWIDAWVSQLDAQPPGWLPH